MFITGPFTDKLVYTNGEGTSGRSYYVRVVKFSKKRNGYSLASAATVLGGSIGVTSYNADALAIAPKNLLDNVSLKVWSNGKAEPMLDWELQQKTADTAEGDTAEQENSQH